MYKLMFFFLYFTEFRTLSDVLVQLNLKSMCTVKKVVLEGIS